MELLGSRRRARRVITTPSTFPSASSRLPMAPVPFAAPTVHWPLLCEIIGRPDLVEDPRTRTNRDRNHTPGPGRGGDQRMDFGTHDRADRRRARRSGPGRAGAHERRPLRRSAPATARHADRDRHARSHPTDDVRQHRDQVHENSRGRQPPTSPAGRTHRGSAVGARVGTALRLTRTTLLREASSGASSGRCRAGRAARGASCRCCPRSRCRRLPLVPVDELRLRRPIPQAAQQGLSPRAGPCLRPCRRAAENQRLAARPVLPDQRQRVGAPRLPDPQLRVRRLRIHIALRSLERVDDPQLVDRFLLGLRKLVIGCVGVANSVSPPVSDKRRLS